MSDIRRIPYTELVERLQKELVRDNSASPDKYGGRINDIYADDIPSQIDWRHLRKIGSVTTVAEYTTGNISAITAGATTVTGDSTVWTSANSNDLNLKVTGKDEVYRCTYVSGTSLTIDRAWVEAAITTDTQYSLVQDRYALASDFDRMILDPHKSVYYWEDGRRVYLKYREPDEFEDIQVVNSNTPSYYTIKWVNGDAYIFIDPPDYETRTLYYVYIPTLKHMFDYTTGGILTLANGSAAVTGTGTAWAVNIVDTSTHVYYLRIDSDGTGAASKWYKILSVDSATGITLASNYLGTSITTSVPYSIAMASNLPHGLDLGILYGAAVISAIDQTNEKQIASWSGLYAKLLAQYRAIKGKKNYGQKRVGTIYERPGVRR